MDAMHIEAFTVGGQRCEFDLEPSCTWNEMKKQILAAFGYEEALWVIFKFGADAHLELLTLVADGKEFDVKVGTDSLVSLGIKPGTKFMAVMGDPIELEKKLINLDPPLAEFYHMSPLDILEQPAMCTALVNKFEAYEPAPKELIEHLLPAITCFALHSDGCRVVQAILKRGNCPHEPTIMQHLMDKLMDMRPFDILEQPAMCTALVKQFQAYDESTPKELIEHLLPAINGFALHSEGCRVVQAILENGCPHMSTIVQHLVDMFEDLYQSPHGNHVLTKAIVALPADDLMGMVSKLKGRAATVARHQYGCRVLERCLEFLPDPQLCFVRQEIVADANSLCRHPYGNFVIQQMLQRGTDEDRKSILQEILKSEGGIPYLASHRTASHVVQSALENCDTDGQHQIVEALLLEQGDRSLLRVATSRYGSYVIEHLEGLSGSCSTLVVVTYTTLRNSQELLRSTPHGCRVAQRFGL